MTDVCYGETFYLLFTQSYCSSENLANQCKEVHIQFVIDSPCWFGDRDEWMERVKTFGTGSDLHEREDCLLASEFTRLRYWNLIDVEKVDFLEDYLSITFPEGNILSVPYEGDSDCEWYLEEIDPQKEFERISIGCCGNELFQNGKEENESKECDMKIEITDYYVMLSLHKALLEAKFHQNPDNIEVAFSPMVADFCNELLDKLTQIDEAKDAGFELFVMSAFSGRFFESFSVLHQQFFASVGVAVAAEPKPFFTRSLTGTIMISKIRYTANPLADDRKTLAIVVLLVVSALVVSVHSSL